jgi:hypothetical protein
LAFGASADIPVNNWSSGLLGDGNNNCEKQTNFFSLQNLLFILIIIINNFFFRISQNKKLMNDGIAIFKQFMERPLASFKLLASLRQNR